MNKHDRGTASSAILFAEVKRGCSNREGKKRDE